MNDFQFAGKLLTITEENRLVTSNIDRPNIPSSYLRLDLELWEELGCDTDSDGDFETQDLLGLQ